MQQDRAAPKAPAPGFFTRLAIKTYTERKIAARFTLLASMLESCYYKLVIVQNSPVLLQYSKTDPDDPSARAGPWGGVTSEVWF